MNRFENMRESAVAEPPALNPRHGFHAAAFLLVLLAAPAYAQLRTSGEFKDSIATPAATKAGATPEDKSIRPFRVHVPESALVDLRQRLAAARLPDRETVTDQSQGGHALTPAVRAACADGPRKHQ